MSSLIPLTYKWTRLIQLYRIHGLPPITLKFTGKDTSTKTSSYHAVKYIRKILEEMGCLVHIIRYKKIKTTHIILRYSCDCCYGCSSRREKQSFTCINRRKHELDDDYFSYDIYMLVRHSPRSRMSKMDKSHPFLSPQFDMGYGLIDGRKQTILIDTITMKLYTQVYLSIERMSPNFPTELLDIIMTIFTYITDLPRGEGYPIIKAAGDCSKKNLKTYKIGVHKEVKGIYIPTHEESEECFDYFKALKK